jgi:putative transposase
LVQREWRVVVRHGLVFSLTTPIYRAEHLKRPEQIFRSVCAEFEVVLKEFNGEPDHVHLLVNSPPKVRLSELVNSLKGVSSRRMKREF